MSQVKVTSPAILELVPNTGGGGTIKLTIQQLFPAGLPGRLEAVTMANISPITATLTFDATVVTVTINSSRIDPFSPTFVATCGAFVAAAMPATK